MMKLFCLTFVFVLASCGSTAPCGLSKVEKKHSTNSNTTYVASIADASDKLAN